MKLRNALLGATMLAAPAAMAQPISGFYVGAGVGYNIVQNSDLSISGVPGVRSGRAEFEGGIVVLGSLGYGFGNGLRLELEGSYRSNDVDKVVLGGVRASTARGRQETYGIMANVLFDIDLGLGFMYPYIGAGAGVGITEWNGVSANNVRLVDDSDTQFAYQGIVGASFPLGGGFAITAEYRFFATLDNEFEIDRRVAARGTLEAENYNHSFLLGLRYAFEQPAPPPVVAPAPAPARTYLVFFDWNRDNLTDRARAIIAEAAQASRSVQTTRIEVSGHADRTGGAAYNQRLSERRANNVAAELVRNGVDRGIITVQGFGFTRPLVPTAQGVREPQNRRVEIVLR
jgi:outer membrane protein OmpA-like peptidoglycan-associated protein